MENNEHILVVDDHHEIRDLLGQYLSRHGMRVTLAMDGVSMREALNEHDDINLIVLDLMMPGEDGLSLCRHVRSIDGPPIIMLTAMGEEADRIVGLEMGADDYISKPFSPRELLARIKAVLRRSSRSSQKEESSEDSDRLRFDRWVLDNNLRQLEDDSELVIPLSTAEYRLLSAFTNNPRRVLSRDQLLDITQGREAMPFDRSIDNQVSRLRKKVEVDPKNPTLIKTVWGGGYMLTAEVVAG
ncbi:response regulator [Parendozoicomonas haliclonae]|uniref:Transcriptional regulatory protein OmpR n=1 Tax=Parendozoicomonas haliclonae TaxID=1960125 RepID=A0A1X7AFN4_9GAMM|nr:response regulator [Parendozoicomonas haliclonae]SMA38126.1 Transcriptional regulatory protein OmpR [Parendozoicomonas haliclonae]